MTVFDSRDFSWNEPPGHFGGFSKYLVNDENQGSRYFDFRISRYPIRGAVELHTHAIAEQIYYVISGSGVIQFGDDRTLASAGQGVFVPPGIPHAIENTGDEDLVFIVVTSPPKDAPRS